MRANVIEIASLTKYYGKDRGIENLNMQVHEGEVFGFIGPNGAGKSTTIRLLVNMLFPTSGTAHIFGMDCFKRSAEIKKAIGYVPSEVAYYDYMRVSDLLNYAASFREGVSAERIQSLCDLFELDASRKISDLSLGNRKKVSVVQALLHKPQLLILDEPTGGLDPLMQNRLFEVFRQEQQERGMTILLSSHNLAEVERHCDRVGIIRDGAMVEVADVDKVDLDNTVMVSLVKMDGERERFPYRDDINSLVQMLAGYDLSMLEIRRASLEDSFLKYYGDDAIKTEAGGLS